MVSMWECSKCHEAIEDEFAVCWNCGTSKDGTEDPEFSSHQETPHGSGDAASFSQIPAGMILATTPSLESHRVQRYLGVVCGEAIVGANIFRDVFAGITDVVGGRSNAYESALADARRVAMAEMAQRARDVGANAVLSMDVDYETLRGSMLMVACSGTAALVEGPQAEKVT